MSQVLNKGCYDAQDNWTTTSQKVRRMSSLRSFAALTAGAFATAALSLPSFAGASRDRTVVTTEFSAENKPDDKNKKIVPGGGGAQKQAPVRVTPRVIDRHNGPPAGAQKNIGQQKNFEVKKKIEVQKKIEVHKDIGVQKNIGTQKTIKLQKTVGKPKVFTPHGKNAGIVITSKILRRAGARRLPHLDPRPQLFALAQRLSRALPRRLAHLRRAQRAWRHHHRRRRILPLRLYRRPSGLLRRTDRGRLPDDL